MNNLESYIKNIKSSPESTQFDEVIETINDYYEYTPTRFTNGSGDNKVTNEAGANEGSCKIFSFAKLHSLDESQTLHCFGRYYREDVLENPEGNDHANIRNFIASGWKGIHFEGEALKPK